MTKALAWLEIDRNKLRNNLNELQRLSPNSPILAMLKGNAYGMGITEIGKILIKKGIKYFGVVGSIESQQLRRINKKIVIIDLNPLNKTDLRYLKQYNISPIIYTLDDIPVCQKLASQKRIKIFIKINTGLNRWGLSYDEAVKAIKILGKEKNIRIEALVTTLNERPEIDRKQITLLTELQQKIKGISKRPLLSFASSQGLLTLNLKDLGLVRPGISLFGVYPDKETYKEKKIKLSPVFELKSKIALIRNLQKGDRLLYKDSFIVTQQTKIGIIPIGYSYGYSPVLKGRSSVLIKNVRCKILAISMSTMMIDISKIEEIDIDEEVVLIGKQQNKSISIYDLAKQSGLSEYYLMTSLSKDIPKIYID